MLKRIVSPDFEKVFPGFTVFDSELFGHHIHPQGQLILRFSLHDNRSNAHSEDASL